MAGTCSTNSLTPQSTSNMLVGASYAGNPPGFNVSKSVQYGLFVVTENEVGAGNATAGSQGWSKEVSGLAADTTYLFRAGAFFDLNWGQVWGGTLSGKLLANSPSLGTPSSSAVTSTTATISCNFPPNVVQSTFSAQLQYKKTTDADWTNAGSPATSGTSESENITGLSSSTEYQVRLILTRTTVNETSPPSATATFTTAAGVPTVVTNAASGVAHNSATLNATVTVNAGTNVEVYWKWGVQNPPTDTTTATQAVSADGAFSVGITGLTASTLYYAQAFVSFDTPSGTPSSGAVVQFTTASAPAAEAADEDHMTIQEYDAVYGVQKAFVFLAASPAATSSDKFLSAAAPWATTECRITKDGGAVADCTNAPTRIGTDAFFTITLEAAELQAENVWVHISDSGNAARDVALHIRTSLEVGRIVANAAQMTNTTAMALTGVGSGHGLSAVGGATGLDIDGVLGQMVQRFNTATAGGASTITLDAGASATNDYYNGSLITIVGGTGAGQSRVITDYAGAPLIATDHKTWATTPGADSVFIITAGDDPWEIVPGAELSAVPSFASSYAKLLQFVFQRFAYKRTQTATVHTMLKADSSTSLATAAVADAGGTQSFAKVS